jgi:hypothetical protein
MLKIIPTVISIIGCLSCYSLAGPIYLISYTKEGKQREHEIVFYGVLSGGFIIGYSESKDKFYTLSYKYKDGKPKPHIKIWNPNTGKHIELYKFEEAGELLMSIDSIEDLKFLPNVTNLKTKYIGEAD